MTTVGLSQGKYPRMLFRATFLYANMNIMTFLFTCTLQIQYQCCLLSFIQY